jgi:pimeloyl-ACP methyl ester carboxylesterase
MEYARSCVATLLHALTFTPRPNKTLSFFDQPASGNQHLLFVPVTLQNMRAPGAASSAPPSACSVIIPILVSVNERISKVTSSNAKIALYFHGNSATIGETAAYFEQVANTSDDFAVISVELPGYGLASPVSRDKHAPMMLPPSPEVWRAVARAFVHRLIHDCGVPANRIVLVGRSMSSGVVLELAAAKIESGDGGVRALALIAPYTRIPRVVGDVMNARFGGGAVPGVRGIATAFVDLLCWFSNTHYFESPTNIAKIASSNNNKKKKKSTPIRIFHGAKDFFVRLENAQELVAAAAAAAASGSENGGSSSVELVLDPEGDHTTVKYADGCADGKTLSEFLNRQRDAMDADAVAERNSGAVKDQKKEVEDVFAVLADSRSIDPATASAFRLELSDALERDTKTFEEWRRPRIAHAKMLIGGVLAVSAITTLSATVLAGVRLIKMWKAKKQ